MRILIVAATTEEILPFLQWMEQQPTETHQIDTLVTGVGLVATTFHMTYILSHNEFDLVIQAGIAGSFRKNIPIGQTVFVLTETIADLGSEDQDGSILSAFDMGFIKKDEFPFENGKIHNPAAESAGFLQQVHAISSNTSHGSQTSIDRLIKQYDPDIESMEGAAFFYACRMMNVPFLEIRAISNYVEPRQKSNWNIPLAIDQLNETLIGIIDVLGAYPADQA
ncbi:MAG TPA: futalosine hydrolase [Saprospiraceae bacterium]|nr:futalosine hydrolase [Saprospiraceae bacterium]